MNLVKEDLLGIQKDRMKIGASLADVDPMQIDKTVGPFMENLSIFNHVLRVLDGSEVQLSLNIRSMEHA
jgi:hypothetical protein